MSNDDSLVAHLPGRRVKQLGKATWGKATWGDASGRGYAYTMPGKFGQFVFSCFRVAIDEDADDQTRDFRMRSR